MAAPVEQQPVDEAAELEVAAAQAVEACGGDMLATIKALAARAGPRGGLCPREPWLPSRTKGAEAQGLTVCRKS